MTQIAAEIIGLPIQNVTFKLGDSALSKSAGGRRIVHRVHGRLGSESCLRQAAQKTFPTRAANSQVSLAKAKLSEVRFTEGEIRLSTDPSRSVPLT